MKSSEAKRRKNFAVARLLENTFRKSQKKFPNFSAVPRAVFDFHLSAGHKRTAFHFYRRYSVEVLQKIAVLVLGLVIVGAIFFMWNGMEINGQAGGINQNTRNTINSIFSFGDARAGEFDHDPQGGWKNL